MTPFARSARRLSLAAAAALAPAAAGAQVAVTVFHGFTGPGGPPFSSPFCTFSTAAIAFGASTGFDWRPCGVGADEEYGAQFVGVLSVAAPASYDFALTSDDGSRLFIDGALVADNGGGHGPLTVVGSTPLAAGLHPFHVDFFECCQGPGGIDLDLPPGVVISPAAVPEPATLPLALGGALALVPLARRRRR
jgi:hypothetical protein